MGTKKNAGGAGNASKDDNGSSAALALPTNDELAGLGEDFEFEVDGLDEIGSEEIKLAAKVFNFKGTDEDGEPVPPNAFFDTIAERAQKEIHCALLHIHKSNLWSEFNNDENRTEVRCRSMDRVTGEMEDGSTRSCNGCPHAKWTANDEGKRGRDCSTVYNVVGIEFETSLPFVIRFKKTSEGVIKLYLQKHHLGRRIVKGVAKDYPLFVFECRITLDAKTHKNYALPVLQKVAVLPKERIHQMHEAAKSAAEMLAESLQRLEDQVVSRETGDGNGGGDASFDPGDFTKDEGEDFVEEPATI